jgi:hypothetical protein
MQPRLENVGHRYPSAGAVSTARLNVAVAGRAARQSAGIREFIEYNLKFISSFHILSHY